MYRNWRELPVADAYHGINIADINRNGLLEIYSAYKDYNTGTLGRIYEYSNDSTFKILYQFPDSIGVGLGIADVDNDGLCEVMFQQLTRPTVSLLFTQKDSLALPVTYRSTFDTISTSGQPRPVSFYDINSDGVMELIYYLDGGGDIFTPGNHIAVYNTFRENFDIVYKNRPNTTYSAGFTFGDFDLDGKQNFSNGGINGELFIYEHVTGNDYTVKFIDTIPTKNAYYSCLTNDLDGNGKPELWMGGDFFYGGTGITRLVAYESTMDDTYSRKYQIDIIGVFSFFAGNMVAADMDGDGKTEIVLCIDQHVLIFKNSGGNAYHLWYFKRNDLALAGLNSVWYEVTVADFDGDNIPEMIIGSDLVINNKIRYFSNVYKKSISTIINKQPEKASSIFQLFQNFPNPFNAETIIRFEIPNSADTDIRIYDLLGKEVLHEILGKLSPGAHEYRWNPNIGSLPSGLYLIRVRSGEYHKIIKAQLLK
jgi:hypothetical protein